MDRLVYIAAPYTQPDPCENTHRAVAIAHRLWDLSRSIGTGWWPVVPHLSHFWHTMSPRPYQDWIDLDLVILDRCDAVVRLTGRSAGADSEVKRATELGIPIWHQEVADEQAARIAHAWLRYLPELEAAR
jgi:hypothetical protein